MSIDARVRTVLCNEDGSGKLLLTDRPARDGGTPGIAGQASLAFDGVPHEVTALNGLDVWGGASDLMLGEWRVAWREGYGKITFVGPETFKAAVAEYHRRHYGHQAAPV